MFAISADQCSEKREHSARDFDEADSSNASMIILQHAAESLSAGLGLTFTPPAVPATHQSPPSDPPDPNAYKHPASTEYPNVSPASEPLSA